MQRSGDLQGIARYASAKSFTGTSGLRNGNQHIVYARAGYTICSATFILLDFSGDAHYSIIICKGFVRIRVAAAMRAKRA